MKKLYTLLGCAVVSMGNIASAIWGSPFIEEPGDGTEQQWVRNSMSIVELAGFMSFVEPDYGGAVRMVEGADSKVWVDHLISSFPTTGWAEGKIEGDELTFSLPQEIYKENGKIYYLAMLDKDYDDSYNVSVAQTLKFVRNGNAWRSTLESDSHILGLVNSDGVFSGVGDYDLELTPFVAPEPVDDSGVEYKRYAFVSGQNGHFLKVGMKDDDVYLAGLLEDDPDVVIVGTRDGDKVSFESGSYIGISYGNSSNPYYNYMVAVSEDAEGEYEVEDALVFTLDEATGRMTSTGTFIYNHTSDLELLAWWDYFEDPEMFIQAPDKHLVPANPTRVIFYPGSDNVITYIPQLSRDGDLLDADLLYYRLYIDDELFFFYPDEYIYLDMEWMEMVPYNYTEEYDFMVKKAFHQIYLYTVGADKVGIQSVYEGEGDTTYSDIVYSDGTVVDGPDSSVANPVASSEGETAVYDIMGRRVSKDTKGLLIVRDGNRVSKALRR